MAGPGRKKLTERAGRALRGLWRKEDGGIGVGGDVAPGLVDAVDDKELRCVGEAVILGGTAEEEGVAAEWVNGGDLDFANAECEVGDRDVESGKRFCGEGELREVDGSFPVVGAKLKDLSGVVERDVADCDFLGAFD